MQERKTYNGVTLPLKRHRTSVSVEHTPSSWFYRDLGKQAFRAEIHQSGKAKAFWFFASLNAELVSQDEKPLISDIFSTGDKEKWKLILWPNKTPGSSALYLQLEIDPQRQSYRRTASVRFRLWITKGQNFECVSDTSLVENFGFPKLDTGCNNFIDHEKYLHLLQSPAIIEITVTTLSPHEDSKYFTGYVGIINEGMTCYVNSLLQTLFFLTSFRRAVYLMPTSVDDVDRLPLSLQLIFYHLQFADSPASARDLLMSFGWNANQFHVQHDIQEFNCVLSDALDKRMKGTLSEGFYSKIFMGKIQNLILCKDIDVKSTRIESFSELQLNVKGCKDIYESLDKYIEAEVLIGENQYDAGVFGKQDAQKLVSFESLPSVLQLQLKRFEYTPHNESMQKINDRFEFYEEIDLSKYIDSKDPHIYRLFSILVHTGSITGGHYYAYISPNLDNNWYKFNDVSVDQALPSQALEANYGGETIEFEVGDIEKLSEYSINSDRSAYMLVYINMAKKDSVLEDIGQVPLHMSIVVESEKKRKAEEEKHKAEMNQKIEISLVAADMILGWDKPGISPPDNPLYPGVSFSKSSINRYKMKIPKHFRGRDLRISLSSHIQGEYRLWIFTPGYRNWEFKELKLSDVLEQELKNKALFIDVENEKSIFRLENTSWKFVNTIDLSTESSQETEMIEELMELQTPSHAKAIVVFKWYDWNWGNPKLTLFKIVTLTSTANMSQIKSSLYESWNGKLPESTCNMILYLEKCKIADLKNKDILNNIHVYKYRDNYELTISKRGTFGVRHVMVDNGDSFVGEIPPENPPENYMDAKKYIMSVCDEVTVNCIYYNKLNETSQKSFGAEFLARNGKNTSFCMQSKLSFTFSQFVNQLIGVLAIDDLVTVEQIQLYILKPGFSTPTLISISEEENKNKKNSIGSTLCSVLETSNTILFDILSPHTSYFRNTLV
ncbi:hypothetical protein SteCoe_14980 [Stentor coeruleus]|uniref:Ubiquitin carboxyl-terminal hydrolase n=1 Tax=Stentor coeruleus TaxID=5963 RepID=A0A1R2C4N9_9CILI|nr:hypothetical protein SteCoe_14980 [Stentor coeruleus]